MEQKFSDLMNAKRITKSGGILPRAGHASASSNFHASHSEEQSGAPPPAPAGAQLDIPQVEEVPQPIYENPPIIIEQQPEPIRAPAALARNSKPLQAQAARPMAVPQSMARSKPAMGLSSAPNMTAYSSMQGEPEYFVPPPATPGSSSLGGAIASLVNNEDGNGQHEDANAEMEPSDPNSSSSRHPALSYVPSVPTPQKSQYSATTKSDGKFGSTFRASTLSPAQKNGRPSNSTSNGSGGIISSFFKGSNGNNTPSTPRMPPNAAMAGRGSRGGPQNGDLDNFAPSAPSYNYSSEDPRFQPPPPQMPPQYETIPYRLGVYDNMYQYRTKDNFWYDIQPYLKRGCFWFCVLFFLVMLSATTTGMLQSYWYRIERKPLSGGKDTFLDHAAVDEYGNFAVGTIDTSKARLYVEGGDTLLGQSLNVLGNTTLNGRTRFNGPLYLSSLSSINSDGHFIFAPGGGINNGVAMRSAEFIIAPPSLIRTTEVAGFNGQDLILTVPDQARQLVVNTTLARFLGNMTTSGLTVAESGLLSKTSSTLYGSLSALTASSTYTSIISVDPTVIKFAADFVPIASLPALSSAATYGQVTPQGFSVTSPSGTIAMSSSIYNVTTTSSITKVFGSSMTSILGGEIRQIFGSLSSSVQGSMLHTIVGNTTLSSNGGIVLTSYASGVLPSTAPQASPGSFKSSFSATASMEATQGITLTDSLQSPNASMALSQMNGISLAIPSGSPGTILFSSHGLGGLSIQGNQFVASVSNATVSAPSGIVLYSSSASPTPPTALNNTILLNAPSVIVKGNLTLDGPLRSLGNYILDQGVVATDIVPASSAYMSVQGYPTPQSAIYAPGIRLQTYNSPGSTLVDGAMDISGIKVSPTTAGVRLYSMNSLPLVFESIVPESFLPYPAPPITSYLLLQSGFKPSVNPPLPTSSGIYMRSASSVSVTSASGMSFIDTGVGVTLSAQGAGTSVSILGSGLTVATNTSSISSTGGLVLSSSIGTLPSLQSNQIQMQAPGTASIDGIVMADALTGAGFTSRFSLRQYSASTGGLLLRTFPAAGSPSAEGSIQVAAGVKVSSDTAQPISLEANVPLSGGIPATSYVRIDAGFGGTIASPGPPTDSGVYMRAAKMIQALSSDTMQLSASLSASFGSVTSLVTATPSVLSLNGGGATGISVSGNAFYSSSSSTRFSNPQGIVLFSNSANATAPAAAPDTITISAASTLNLVSPAGITLKGSIAMSGSTNFNDASPLFTAALQINNYPVSGVANGGVILQSYKTPGSVLDVDGSVSVNAGVQVVSKNSFPLRIESIVPAGGGTPSTAYIFMAAGYGGSALAYPLSPASAGIYLYSAKTFSLLSNEQTTITAATGISLADSTTNFKGKLDIGNTGVLVSGDSLSTNATVTDISSSSGVIIRSNNVVLPPAQAAGVVLLTSSTAVSVLGTFLARDKTASTTAQMSFTSYTSPASSNGFVVETFDAIGNKDSSLQLNAGAKLISANSQPIEISSYSAGALSSSYLFLGAGLTPVARNAKLAAIATNNGIFLSSGADISIAATTTSSITGASLLLGDVNTNKVVVTAAGLAATDGVSIATTRLEGVAKAGVVLYAGSFTAPATATDTITIKAELATTIIAATTIISSAGGRFMTSGAGLTITSAGLGFPIVIDSNAAPTSIAGTQLQINSTATSIRSDNGIVLQSSASSAATTIAPSPNSMFIQTASITARDSDVTTRTALFNMGTYTTGGNTGGFDFRSFSAPGGLVVDSGLSLQNGPTLYSKNAFPVTIFSQNPSNAATGSLVHIEAGFIGVPTVNANNGIYLKSNALVSISGASTITLSMATSSLSIANAISMTSTTSTTLSATTLLTLQDASAAHQITVSPAAGITAVSPFGIAITSNSANGIKFTGQGAGGVQADVSGSSFKVSGTGSQTSIKTSSTLIRSDGGIVIQSADAVTPDLAISPSTVQITASLAISLIGPVMFKSGAVSFTGVPLKIEDAPSSVFFSIDQFTSAPVSGGVVMRAGTAFDGDLSVQSGIQARSRTGQLVVLESVSVSGVTTAQTSVLIAAGYNTVTSSNGGSQGIYLKSAGVLTATSVNTLSLFAAAGALTMTAAAGAVTLSSGSTMGITSASTMTLASVNSMTLSVASGPFSATAGTTLSLSSASTFTMASTADMSISAATGLTMKSDSANGVKISSNAPGSGVAIDVTGSSAGLVVSGFKTSIGTSSTFVRSDGGIVIQATPNPPSVVGPISPVSGTVQIHGNVGVSITGTTSFLGPVSSIGSPYVVQDIAGASPTAKLYISTYSTTCLNCMYMQAFAGSNIDGEMIVGYGTRLRSQSGRLVVVESVVAGASVSSADTAVVLTAGFTTATASAASSGIFLLTNAASVITAASSNTLSLSSANAMTLSTSTVTGPISISSAQSSMTLSSSTAASITSTAASVSLLAATTLSMKGTTSTALQSGTSMAITAGTSLAVVTSSGDITLTSSSPSNGIKLASTAGGYGVAIDVTSSTNGFAVTGAGAGIASTFKTDRSFTRSDGGIVIQSTPSGSDLTFSNGVVKISGSLGVNILGPVSFGSAGGSNAFTYTGTPFLVQDLAVNPTAELMIASFTSPNIDKLYMRAYVSGSAVVDGEVSVGYGARLRSQNGQTVIVESANVGGAPLTTTSVIISAGFASFSTASLASGVYINSNTLISIAANNAFTLSTASATGSISISSAQNAITLSSNLATTITSTASNINLNAALALSLKASTSALLQSFTSMQVTAGTSMALTASAGDMSLTASSPGTGLKLTSTGNGVAIDVAGSANGFKVTGSGGGTVTTSITTDQSFTRSDSGIVIQSTPAGASLATASGVVKISGTSGVNIFGPVTFGSAGAGGNPFTYTGTPFTVQDLAVNPTAQLLVSSFTTPDTDKIFMRAFVSGSAVVDGEVAVGYGARLRSQNGQSVVVESANVGGAALGTTSVIISAGFASLSSASASSGVYISSNALISITSATAMALATTGATGSISLSSAQSSLSLTSSTATSITSAASSISLNAATLLSLKATTTGLLQTGGAMALTSGASVAVTAAAGDISLVASAALTGIKLTSAGLGVSIDVASSSSGFSVTGASGGSIQTSITTDKSFTRSDSGVVIQSTPAGANIVPVSGKVQISGSSGISLIGPVTLSSGALSFTGTPFSVQDLAVLPTAQLLVSSFTTPNTDKIFMKAYVGGTAVVDGEVAVGFGARLRSQNGQTVTIESANVGGAALATTAVVIAAGFASLASAPAAAGIYLNSNAGISAQAANAMTLATSGAAGAISISSALSSLSLSSATTASLTSSAISLAASTSVSIAATGTFIAATATTTMSLTSGTAMTLASTSSTMDLTALAGISLTSNSVANGIKLSSTGYGVAISVAGASSGFQVAGSSTTIRTLTSFTRSDNGIVIQSTPSGPDLTLPSSGIVQIKGETRVQITGPLSYIGTPFTVQDVSSPANPSAMISLSSYVSPAVPNIFLRSYSGLSIDGEVVVGSSYGARMRSQTGQLIVLDTFATAPTASASVVIAAGGISAYSAIPAAAGIYLSSLGVVSATSTAGITLAGTTAAGSISLTSAASTISLSSTTSSISLSSGTSTSLLASTSMAFTANTGGMVFTSPGSTGIKLDVTTATNGLQVVGTKTTITTATSFVRSDNGIILQSATPVADLAQASGTIQISATALQLSGTLTYVGAPFLIKDQATATASISLTTYSSSATGINLKTGSVGDGEIIVSSGAKVRSTTGQLVVIESAATTGAVSGSTSVVISAGSTSTYSGPPATAGVYIQSGTLVSITGASGNAMRVDSSGLTTSLTSIYSVGNLGGVVLHSGSNAPGAVVANSALIGASGTLLTMSSLGATLSSASGSPISISGNTGNIVMTGAAISATATTAGLTLSGATVSMSGGSGAVIFSGGTAPTATTGQVAISSSTSTSMSSLGGSVTSNSQGILVSGAQAGTLGVSIYSGSGTISTAGANTIRLEAQFIKFVGTIDFGSSAMTHSSGITVTDTVIPYKSEFKVATATGITLRQMSTVGGSVTSADGYLDLAPGAGPVLGSNNGRVTTVYASSGAAGMVYIHAGYSVGSAPAVSGSGIVLSTASPISITSGSTVSITGTAYNYQNDPVTPSGKISITNTGIYTGAVSKFTMASTTTVSISASTSSTITGGTGSFVAATGVQITATTGGVTMHSNTGAVVSAAATAPSASANNVLITTSSGGIGISTNSVPNPAANTIAFSATTASYSVSTYSVSTTSYAVSTGSASIAGTSAIAITSTGGNTYMSSSAASYIESTANSPSYRVLTNVNGIYLGRGSGSAFVSNQMLCFVNNQYLIGYCQNSVSTAGATCNCVSF